MEGAPISNQCARTKYPSEIHKRWTIIVRAAIDNRAANSALLSMLEFNNCGKFGFCSAGNNLYSTINLYS